MQTLTVYNFKDLEKEKQKFVYNDFLNIVIEGDIEFLNYLLSKGELSESEYFNILGCSKHYAEVTSWFIPSCYYEKNKSEVNKKVKSHLKDALFTKSGKFIEYLF